MHPICVGIAISNRDQELFMTKATTGLKVELYLI